MFQGRWARLSASVCVFAALSSPALAKAQVDFIPGEYVVKLRTESLLVSTRTLGNELGGDVLEVVSREARTVLISRPVVEKAEFAVQSLNAHPIVVYAEPNYVYRTSALPNDPEFGKLWGLINSGQEIKNSAGKAGVDIDIQRAWEITTGSREVVVAVIDTGVDFTNPDLAPNMWENEAEKNGQAGIDDDNNGFVDDVYGYDFANNDGNPKDDNDHGTHCSGTIGAQGDDAQGIVGVNWQVRIMAVKFLSAAGGGTLANAVKSIDYARQMGARIMSNSWGGGGASQALQEAIERARDAGILFIAAAGNSAMNNDETPTYPANYPVDNIVSVAAINNQGELADFSCYGAETVHVGAPGVAILSTTLRGLEFFDGTSMATPHVSGVAALMLAHEPNLSYAAMKERLIATSRPIAGLRGKVKGGLVSAYHAVTNTPPELDPNDPYNWPRQEYALSTPHPYPKNWDRTWTVTVPGVQKFALLFSRFDTEAGYDKVTFRKPDGEVIAVWSGRRDNQLSPVIEGDTVVISISSDHTVQRYGFDISAIAYQ